MQAMNATLTSGRPEATFRGVAIDSRKVVGGELFFALAGAESDGHRWVDSAIAAGAAGAVVERPTMEPDGSRPLAAAAGGPSGAALLQVADTYRALHDLTRAVRRGVPERLIGLTGSAGKTTTKELLAAMLGRRYRVAKTPGNLNNLYGFPLSLLNIPDDSEWMVAEMGMSLPGELSEISRLARPDVALLLNVRPAHLENFGSLPAIAEAKAEILHGLADGGLLVANADDAEVRRVATAYHRGPLVWFGTGRGPIRPQVSAEEITPLGSPEDRGRAGYRFRLVVREDRPAGAESESIEVRCPLHGRYNVDNALAAAACAHALGVGLAEIRDALAESGNAAGRGGLLALDGGVTLIDDSYNSNPEALDRALEAAALLPGKRHWAVIGEMLELGPDGPAYHAAAGKNAAEAGFDPILGVGELARRLTEEARKAGAEAAWFATADEARERAESELRDGDTVLVKGSRGVGLDRVVEALAGRRRNEEGSDVL